MVALQCRPVKAAWGIEQLNPELSTCFKPGPFIAGVEIANVVIDVGVLLLPVYMVQKLQMRVAKKVSIICIFLLGGL